MTNPGHSILAALAAGKDEEVAHLLPLLLTTRGLPHGISSLLSHLCGTARILAAENSPFSIVGGGLFHSIYSTEFYPYAAFDLSCRSDVMNAIGRDSETLAHLFCTIKRGTLWKNLENNNNYVIECLDSFDNVIHIPREIATALFQIECANIIEQSCTENGSPAPFMSWYFEKTPAPTTRFFSRQIREFSKDKETAAIAIYKKFWSAKERKKPEWLFLAAQMNPFSSELQLLTALHFHISGPRAMRDSFLVNAELLLEAWGTPWDKRLTFKAWKQLILEGKKLQTPHDAIRLREHIERELSDIISVGDSNEK